MEMRSRWCRLLLLLISFTPLLALASEESATGYLQVIQIVNFLANTGIANTGMTPTSVTLQFYDDSSGKPCWTTTLAYQADFTIHAGAGQNCPNIINKISVTPIIVATLLQTYSGPYTATIDTTKYANQVTILQATAPVFDTASGLVTTPGTVKAEIQSQSK